MLAIGFFLALMLCIVLKISFSLNAEVLVIKKHGVFRYFSHSFSLNILTKLRRSTTLEFAINRTSLHYYRTHFSDEQAWLQLIIKEGPRFYQIFSWKGKVSRGRGLPCASNLEVVGNLQMNTGKPEGQIS